MPKLYNKFITKYIIAEYIINGQKYVKIIESNKKIDNIIKAKLNDILPFASGLLNFLFGCCESFFTSKMSFKI